MNHSSPRFLPSSRLLLALLTCLPLGSACSEDDAAPVKPTTFGVVISSLDGNAPEKPVALRCDQGGASLADGGAGGAAPAVGAFSTLVVGVTLSPDALSSTHFVLRPAHACGSSKRCGYVRIEGLDDAGQVVASVDTVTTEGVLQLNFGALPTELRATLISGVDQSILKNPDKTEVTTSVTPSFVVPAACGETSGPGGAGGDGGAGPTPGGAGPGGGGVDANLGGAAGDASLGGAGGLSSAGNGGDGG